MAAQPLVYVHGAGRQKPASDLKHDLDLILFGRDMATTRVARYSDVRWPPASAGGPRTIGPDRSRRARRQQAIRLGGETRVSPKAAAAAIVAAALAPTLRRARGLAATPPPTPSPEELAARRLVEQFYRRADRVAMGSAARRPGLALGLSFPDPIFRFVVGVFASDVVDYLYGGYAERMRAPVREALLNGPPPRVIVAHSLGTIVAYDVLSEPAFTGLDVRLLVTAGSPLGIGNVYDRLRDGAGRPNPVPVSLKAWSNFADRWDPVALDPTLRDEFTPPKGFARDQAVNNPAGNNHDLTGYLSVAVVRSTIVDAAG